MKTKLVSLGFLLLTLSSASVAEDSTVTATNGVPITVYSDDFANRYEYTAPKVDFTGNDGEIGFVMVSSVKTSSKIIKPYLMGYIIYSDDWRRYNSAVFKGGAEADFTSIDRSVSSCRSRPCSLSESFKIDLTEKDISTHESDGFITIQVRSGSAHKFLINVPVAYFDAIKEVSTGK